MKKIAKLVTILIALSLGLLAGCGSVKVYEASTGMPVKNYEVTIKTPSDVEPVIAQFHIVRMVYEGKYQYIPVYYDIFRETAFSRAEAERTMSLRMVIRIINPTGLKISLMYRKQSLGEGREGARVSEEEEEEEAAKQEGEGITTGEMKGEEGQPEAAGGDKLPGTKDAGPAVHNEAKEVLEQEETEVPAASGVMKKAEDTLVPLKEKETDEAGDGSVVKEQDKREVAESVKETVRPAEKKRKGVWESLFPARKGRPAETKEPEKTKEAVETPETLSGKEPSEPVAAREPEEPAETQEPELPLVTDEAKKPAEAEEPLEPSATREVVLPLEAKPPIEALEPVEAKEEPLLPGEGGTKTPVETVVTEEPQKAVVPEKLKDAGEPLATGKKGEPGKGIEIKKRLEIPKAREDKQGWVTKDEVVYTGTDRDVLRFIDCPMTQGQHKVGLWVYRDNFLLFEFANFEYTVK